MNTNTINVRKTTGHTLIIGLQKLGRIRKLRGLFRMLGILVGWKAETSHEVATHCLMILGFIIEGYILLQVITGKVSEDFTEVVQKYPALTDLIIIGLCFVVSLLLFHQFVIFRNFSLPTDAANRAQGRRIGEAVQESLNRLRLHKDSESAIMLLSEVAPINQASGVGRHWTQTPKKFVEILVYALFGVLTGEAGYMLTVLHEHSLKQPPWAVKFAWSLFGTRGMGWGETLECAFLLCATAICLAVLVWDAIVSMSETAKQEYQTLLKTFWWNDAWSFAFWFCLFAVVTPQARWWLGVRFDPPNIGLCLYVWAFLAFFSAVYVSRVGKRFMSALNKLGEAGSYSEARFKKI